MLSAKRPHVLRPGDVQAVRVTTMTAARHCKQRRGHVTTALRLPEVAA